MSTPIEAILGESSTMQAAPMTQRPFLVDLDQPALEGFRAFIGSWVLTHGTTTLVVDPGPRSTIPNLLGTLKARGVDRVDGILLTHIHIDHAGGAGLLAERFPDARVLCHPKGIPHLVDPAKLWEGSRSVLGKVADAYGSIEPVPEERIAFEDKCEIGNLVIESFDTPGHAAHHLSYRVGGLLFAGEVAGIRLETVDGTYQRPATPPRFEYDVYRGSLDRAAALGADALCLGHRGRVDDPDDFFAYARNQLDRWVDTARKHLYDDPEGWTAPVLEELLATDPRFTRLTTLPPDVQTRERYFAANSLDGLRRFLETEG